MKMIPWCESKGHSTETQDEAVLDISCIQSVQILSDGPHTDADNQQTGTCTLCTEDGKLLNDSISSNSNLLLKEQSSSSLDQEHDEKIKEFQFYVEMISKSDASLRRPLPSGLVKKIARPGCSQEMLNVALSSMSSLVKKLSVVSSKQYMHSSL